MDADGSGDALAVTIGGGIGNGVALAVAVLVVGATDRVVLHARQTKQKVVNAARMRANSNG